MGGHSWRANADQIAQRVRTPITVQMIGERGGLYDPYGDWANRSQVDTTGCVLVDPTAMSHGAAPPQHPTDPNNYPTPSTEHSG